ncbi:MAG: efflux RND transporter periplasmic adaptor subunit [Pirellulales bacterium]|nr:efflux RND transporter periplasmic adaptor subunit [Pirellulales bacterium]
MKQLFTQELLLLTVAVAATTFLLGGLAGYLVLSKYGLALGVLQAGDKTNGTEAGAADEGKGQGPQAMLVRVGTVEREPIVPVRTLVGDLIAVRTATIPTEVAGKVVKLPVDEGTKVIGGKTLLARIDDTWTKLDDEKIATQIAEKEATLSFEKDELKRYEGMLKDEAVSLSETEKERTVIKELEASIAELNVMLKECRERKDRLDIIAPFDGSVVAKHTEIGEYVPIGSRIVDIVSTGRIDARIMVPEASLPLLDVGDELDVVVDSLGLELRGKVFSINAQGSVGSRTFPVRVELDDQNGILLPGMGVSVFVPVMHESTQLLVPRDAVLTKPDGSMIWIIKPKDVNTDQSNPQKETLVAQPVPVRVLSRSRDAYAIYPERDSDKNLVVPGVKVVLEGLERLIPGVAVRIDPDISPLSPVPGMYRTGQQIIDRPKKNRPKGWQSSR